MSHLGSYTFSIPTAFQEDVQAQYFRNVNLTYVNNSDRTPDGDNDNAYVTSIDIIGYYASGYPGTLTTPILN